MTTQTTPRRLLLYVEQNYSFDILRPVQTEAQLRGHDVRWLLLQDAEASNLEHGEVSVRDAAAAVAFEPHAVFAPGDRVPAFIPGLKVQVFHGLNEDKRGNQYAERGLFDLYCTQGPAMTDMLNKLRKGRDWFNVVETGWPKLDTIFNYPSSPKGLANREPTEFDRPQVFFASTFTPSLSCAEALLPVISKLSRSPEWHWHITLHPKMDPKIVARYQTLQNQNLRYYGTDQLAALFHRADLMVSDNSSILQEFLLMNKPVVTYRNRAPAPHLINIRQPKELERAMQAALHPDQKLQGAIAAYGPALTPWLDGASSGRVLDAAEEMLDSGWQDRKPANWLRNFKMRRQLKYFSFGH